MSTHKIGHVVVLNEKGQKADLNLVRKAFFCICENKGADQLNSASR